MTMFAFRPAGNPAVEDDELTAGAGGLQANSSHNFVDAKRALTWLEVSVDCSVRC